MLISLSTNAQKLAVLNRADDKYKTKADFKIYLKELLKHGIISENVYLDALTQYSEGKK